MRPPTRLPRLLRREGTMEMLVPPRALLLVPSRASLPLETLPMPCSTPSLLVRVSPPPLHWYHVERIR